MNPIPTKKIIKKLKYFFIEITSLLFSNGKIVIRWSIFLNFALTYPVQKNYSFGNFIIVYSTLKIVNIIFLI